MTSLKEGDDAPERFRQGEKNGRKRLDEKDNNERFVEYAQENATVSKGIEQGIIITTTTRHHHRKKLYVKLIVCHNYLVW